MTLPVEVVEAVVLFLLRVPIRDIVSTTSSTSGGGEETVTATGTVVGGCDINELLLLRQLPVLTDDACPSHFFAVSFDEALFL